MAKALPVSPTPNTYNGYNLSPGGASGGGGAFGTNVAQISAPPSIYDELKSNVPNYAGLTAGATGDINSELSGNLSQGTQNLLQNKAAAAGIDMGMPGGTAGNTLTNQNFLQSLGLTSEGLAHEGLTDYNTFANTAGSQQQNPELLTSIAEQNAVDAAAPNPAAANSYAQSLFQRYLQQTSNPAGGTGAGSKGKPPEGLSFTPAGSLAGTYLPMPSQ